MRQFAVHNRGTPPESFRSELIRWGKMAAEDIFAPNPLVDIYSKTKSELGPWISPLQRRAGMLEIMRVLAGFESSWDWTEGVDTSRLGSTTPENAEAGAWQVSYDARLIDVELGRLLATNRIATGLDFQRAMKFDHFLAMEFIARLMRHTTEHNGPLYKGDERLIIRKSLRGPENSIYPWLSRESMQEFQQALS